MKRQVVVMNLISVGIVAGTVACGGTPNENAADHGSGAVPTTSSASTDAGASAPPLGDDAGEDAGAATFVPTSGEDAGSGSPPDADSPPVESEPDAGLPSAVGSLLTAETDITLDGVTDDGFVVYRTGTALEVVPMNAGTPVVIGAASATARVSGVGVFVSGAARAPIRSGLSFWTEAKGLRGLTRDYVPESAVAASPDGTRAAFLVASASRTGPMLTVANADGSDPVNVGTACVSGLSLGATELTVTGCNSTLDSGTIAQNFAVYSASTLRSTIAGPFFNFSEDASGTWLWLEGVDGAGSLVRIDTGATVFTDEAVSRGIFDPAGAALFYATGGALKKLTTADAAASTLVPSGCTAVYLVSPDGTKVLADVNGQATVLSPSDSQEWQVGSASIPGEGYAFSLDSRYALLRQPAAGARGWNYSATPLAAQLPAAGFTNVRGVTPLAGTHVILQAFDGAVSIADLAGTDETIALPGATSFVVSKDGTQIAYVARGVAEPGLYVVSGERPAKNVRGHFGT
jgi:hypothetical protein